MRILGIPLMLIGLVDETQSLVRVVISHKCQCGGQWQSGLFTPPQKVRGGSPGSLSAEPMPVMAASIV